ncbi:response regulator [Polaromonas eurypsychrophila]|uniref:Two-component system response regulator n=1 Tax=Polaromonas eurypsychrophila TaxID=1614635 RepID=A0A916WJ89_9BURK|nr:response regulator [Polaromonas eurypsychrophila]GGB06465.1 two-component system response regulator [Polaromonas eurypsychrophila]
MKATPLADSRFAEVLLVEDNEDDVFLTREAFDLTGLRVHLHHVDNGVNCLQFLRREGPYGEAPTPDLILLDIHMPVMDGYEVLAEIVKDDKLKHLPVVVLTTSYEAADIQKMYALRCNSYITKSVDFDHFVKAIGQLAGYWLSVVVIPQSGGVLES